MACNLDFRSAIHINCLCFEKKFGNVFFPTNFIANDLCFTNIRILISVIDLMKLDLSLWILYLYLDLKMGIDFIIHGKFFTYYLNRYDCRNIQYYRPWIMVTIWNDLKVWIDSEATKKRLNINHNMDN